MRRVKLRKLNGMVYPIFAKASLIYFILNDMVMQLQNRFDTLQTGLFQETRPLDGILILFSAHIFCLKSNVCDLLLECISARHLFAVIGVDRIEDPQGRACIFLT
jgi:hypothetical protein